jgi:hypothetical protein
LIFLIIRAFIPSPFASAFSITIIRSNPSCDNTSSCRF